MRDVLTESNFDEEVVEGFMELNAMCFEEDEEGLQR